MNVSKIWIKNLLLCPCTYLHVNELQMNENSLYEPLQWQLQISPPFDATSKEHHSVEIYSNIWLYILPRYSTNGVRHWMRREWQTPLRKQVGIPRHFRGPWLFATPHPWPELMPNFSLTFVPRQMERTQSHPPHQLPFFVVSLWTLQKEC